MAAQPPNINDGKYTLVCVERGDGRWRVEKERIMGLSLVGKEEDQKSICTMRYLGFKWGLGEGRIVKSRNQNN